MSNIKHSFDDHTSTIPAVQEVTATPAAPRRMTLNMGPQHPSTHGVLRIVLELEGETIISAAPDIGFLHTGIEKEFEQKNWQQAVTLTDRVDYLANLSNNLVYALAVEKLLQIEIPERAQWTRVMMTELQRLNSLRHKKKYVRRRGASQSLIGGGRKDSKGDSIHGGDEGVD